MAPLLSQAGDRLLVPVGLHRTRLWSRGLVGTRGARTVATPWNGPALTLARRTPPPKGMRPIQRRKTLAGAFRVRNKAAVAGETMFLINDVLASASTVGEISAVDALKPMPKYRVKDDT